MMITPEHYKVELHQHVDGSIPIELTWKLMHENHLSPVDSISELRGLLSIQPEDDGKGLLKYLEKFHYPLWITQFYENIAEVSYAIAKEAYANGVRLFELRYSPIIHTYSGLTPRQALVSVFDGLNRAEQEFKDLTCGVIVIAMRHLGPHIAKILARTAISEAQYTHERVGVVGFDIAGAERGNPPRLFREAYAICHRAGIGLTAHAGEDEGPHAVWQAIDELGVTRIGHGCSAIKDKTLMQRLAKDKILIECCPSSNYHTGAVKKPDIHPIFEFLEAGVPVAICTDNTTVSNTNQEKENGLVFRWALDNKFDIELNAIHETAARHSFIPISRRRAGAHQM
jgi:adenosine deaminase